MGKRKALEASELYTVGWISALPKEMTAALGMLDERHDKPKNFAKHPTDTNSYSWGQIGDHNVVISSLAAGVYGPTSAATTAMNMLSSFPNIKVGLMVGIGAGIPSAKYDIRLGDVVVSQPHGQTGGVIQYDLGKSRVSTEQGNLVHTFERVGILKPPPEALLKALSLLQAEAMLEGSNIPEFLNYLLERYPRLAQKRSDGPGYFYQGDENDRLFEASYLHTSNSGCGSCDSTRMISRSARSDPSEPEVHYGVIASGNKLVKDAAERDLILEQSGEDCICLEMEAAGLMNSFPCLVIRGICDYADSHKNDDWQEYAAATAAAYAKDFLGYVDNGDLARTSKASEILGKISKDNDEIKANLKLAREKIEEMHLDDHQKEIRDWLSAPDPSTNYTNALEKRHPDTGLWFIDGEAFERWKGQPNSFLWLHGIPGCGKTVLSSTIIQHLKITARREEDIEMAFRHWTQPEDRIGIQESDIDGDIRAYVHHTVRNSSELARWQSRPDVQDEIELELVKKADGMFRWVFCQLDALKVPLDYPGLRQALDGLPDTLDETYSRILEGIPRQRMNQAMTVLNLLIWSDSPSRIDELVDAVAINLDDEDPIFDPKNRMPVPEEVLKLCSSLVVISWDDYGMCEDVVQIAHFSVKEYLVSHNVSRCFKSLANETVAKAYLARLCLTYLIGLSRLWPGTSEWDGSGLIQTVKYLIDNVEATTRGTLEDALRSASREGHDTIVQLLLERGANANAKNGAVLRIAAAGGHDMIVRLLLDWGTDANARHGAALRYASECGHDKVLQLLLDRGADVNARDDAALKNAAYHGYDTIVQLLLDRGADVNARDDAALQNAAYCGHDTIVQLLLDKGADVNAGDGKALEAASRGGRDTTVQLLLDRGADINAQNGAALRSAVNESTHTTVQLLLDNGADIDLRDEDGANVLMTAFKKHDIVQGMGGPWLCELQHIEGNIVVLLPYLSLEIASQTDVGGCNTLHYAALYESESVVQKCLDLGVDVHARDDYGTTALHFAAWKGYLKIVKALLRAGADPEDPDMDGTTPLACLAHLAPWERRARSWDRGRKPRWRSIRLSTWSGRESSLESDHDSDWENDHDSYDDSYDDSDHDSDHDSDYDSDPDSYWESDPESSQESSRESSQERSWEYNQENDWEVQYQEYRESRGRLRRRKSC
ncbi:purine and uridine phosphorylase, partial [Aureobasidium melanogenum]